MLTLLELKFPEPTDDPKENYRRITNTLTEYLRRLNMPGALAVDEAQTFTPGLTFGGGSTGMTFTTQEGSFFTIRDWVIGNGFIQISAKGSSTGDARISNLPHTIRNDNDSYFVPSVQLNNVSFANQFMARGLVNTATIDLFELTEAGTRTTLTAGNFADNSQVVFSFAYRRS